MHLSVLFHHKNGKITIKTEILHKYNNLLLITITLTSNSFNENTNNSIEGNIPLFSAKQNIQQYLNDFAVSFGPLYDQA